MSNEGIQQSVLDEVDSLAEKLYYKIAVDKDDDAKRKRVIGFGFFVYHEDGTIATDAIGYWDRHRVQARMTNFLQKLSFAQEAQVSDAIFYPDDGKTHTEPRQPLTNEQARPQLWKGF